MASASLAPHAPITNGKLAFLQILMSASLLSIGKPNKLSVLKDTPAIAGRLPSLVDAMRSSRANFLPKIVVTVLVVPSVHNQPPSSNAHDLPAGAISCLTAGTRTAQEPAIQRRLLPSARGRGNRFPGHSRLALFLAGSKLCKIPPQVETVVSSLRMTWARSQTYLQFANTLSAPQCRTVSSGSTHLG